jgi:bifunctional DNase/RNase
MAAAASTLTGPVAGERELLDAVRGALELLPLGQRDVVLMHYIDDLSCDQIAQLLATSPGAVRVRLHRARRQLRRELAPLAPVPVPAETKERAMVDVKVEDILVRLADDDAAQVVEQIALVVLKEQRGDRALPILISLVEGAALATRLADESFPRPLTSDLTVELLRAAGATIERVAITRVRDNTFFAQISIKGEELDARPSDAINLAARSGVPIVVDERLLEEHALRDETLEEWLERRSAMRGVTTPAGKWQSLSAELVRAIQPRWPRSTSD